MTIKLSIKRTGLSLAAYFVGGALLVLSTAHAEDNAAMPRLTEHYVMLYYEDIEAPRRFYGELLGLEASFEDEWVSLYRVTPASFVGVVRESDGAWHRPQAQNAVMVSIVTDDVDAWYRRVSAAGDVTILKEIYDNPSVPIRAFLMQDPGGYTVEMFQWVR